VRGGHPRDAAVDYEGALRDNFKRACRCVCVRAQAASALGLEPTSDMTQLLEPEEDSADGVITQVTILTVGRPPTRPLADLRGS
jgi:hypothetical protein